MPSELAKDPSFVAPTATWPPARRGWRVAQTAVWAVGVTILLLLFLVPTIGLHAFWNVLIPVAPALLVFAPGIWRNVCPMATVGLLARHFGLSQRARPTRAWTARLLLAGVVLLFTIVPLRHVVLDTSGFATGVAIVILALAAALLGLIFEWKSAWCSGLCPVHPVERLYGAAPAISPPNAHCSACASCVGRCPDSTSGVGPPGMDPSSNVTPPVAATIAGVLMVGAFPGFIWGWFQVPDWHGSEGWNHVHVAYGWPIAGAAVTAALYGLIRGTWPHLKSTRRVFAAGAICCYYWYRLPALFGFGSPPGDGTLVDLRGSLPDAFPLILRVTSTVLFLWWLTCRPDGAWTRRPPVDPAIRARLP